MPSVKRLLARAKLNLSLQVEHKKHVDSLQKTREEKTDKKLHKIRSSIVFLKLHDVLIVEERQKGGVMLEVIDQQAGGSFVKIPSGEENLILRAARELERATQVSIDCQITLHKNIPAGAGLGGGSSDAAAFLLYAKKKVTLAKKKWLDIAKEIGSDVAMFMLREKTNNLLVEGTGDRIAPRESLKACGVVLICGQGLATGEVYRRYSLAEQVVEDGSEATKVGKVYVQDYRKDYRQEIIDMRNDLQEVACRLDARIGKRIEALRACEGIFCARMTGSGSACFGLTKLGDEENIAEGLRLKGLGNVFATRFLG